MTKQTLNQQVIIDLIGDDPDSAKQFYRDFLVQAKSSFDKLRDYCKTAQYQSLKDEAHYLKTSAKAIGAEILAEQLQSLEEAALNNDKDACIACVKAIHYELGNELTNALKPILLAGK
ncbi:Hpt domain-containing protein (plasmid) [Pseudoalteromonas sp. T1lg65]|uniref:Hpt domain-containing protein n=1 Tax=Pseudoalteromonas sp. T1lg65 TaxID=2077101 RepID=UPI003F7A0715